MTDALVAENLARSYGETRALDGISLSIAEGEVFALVGPNGAGKTTLVRAVTGTTDASGHVELFGEQPRAVDRERIGLLPQNFAPHERLTARELVGYYGGLYDDARDVADVLADVGMAEDAETYYENLSGGQQRRTCVGTALVNDPDLLVLDEPTTGVDPAGRRDLWTVIEGLASEGVAVLVTTHYMDEAHRLGDRVGLLADGRLVACDDPDALVAEHAGEPVLTVSAPGLDAVPEALDRPATLVEGEVRIEGVAPEDVGGVAATLESAGVTYESLTWAEADLEDVYLSLTEATEGAS